MADPGCAKGGGKVERRRREYRGAEGAEVWGGGFPYLLGERSGEEQCILSTIFAVQLPIVQTRNTAFGLTKLAAAAMHAMHSTETAKGGKPSLLESRNLL